MRLISQIYDDLFASCGGLQGDLFDDFQQTLAADENIQGVTVSAGGKEVVIYQRKKGNKKDD